MTPDLLLDRYLGQSNGRKQRSLRIIDDICREQIARGSNDFSIATIGKLSESRGGPSCQAIRNKSGADYRALIVAWSSQLGVKIEKQRKSNAAEQLDEVLKHIVDPAIRAEVGFLLAENRKLKGQVRLLQQAVKHSVVIDRSPAPTEQLGSKSTAYDLSELERTALAGAVSSDFLTENGWHADQRGAVLDIKSGRRIFKNGFVTALKKVLAQPKDESKSREAL